MKGLIRILVLIGFAGFSAFSQIEKPENLKPEKISGPVPIVFGSKKDGFPENMKVRGIIKELTFAEAACGVIAWSGTLKIELTQKIENYDKNNVFVVIGCFGDFEKFERDESKYLNKEIEINVSKLYPNYRFGYFKNVKKVPCAFEIITNEISSDGSPFYCAGSVISESIEKIEKLKP